MVALTLIVASVSSFADACVSFRKNPNLSVKQGGLISPNPVVLAQQSGRSIIRVTALPVVVTEKALIIIPKNTLNMTIILEKYRLKCNK